MPIEIILAVIIIMLVGYLIGKFSPPNEKPCGGNYVAKVMVRRK